MKTYWDEVELWQRNLKKAKPEDIELSDIQCPDCKGVFMERYKGKELVNWTSRCPNCHVMRHVWL